MKKFVSITDAGSLLGISRPRLSKIIKEKNIPKQKKGGTYQVDYNEVKNLIEKMRDQGRIRKKTTETTVPPACAKKYEDTTNDRLEEQNTVLARLNQALSDTNERIEEIEKNLKELKVKANLCEVPLRSSFHIDPSLKPSVIPISSSKRDQAVKVSIRYLLTKLFAPWDFMSTHGGDGKGSG